MEFDLVVIGAGSGGVAASRRAAAHGARVAIVEAGRVGGTCVLRGCVPKKLLMYAAEFDDTFAQARGYGWTIAGVPDFDMAVWQAAKSAETARLEGIYRRLLEGSGVTLFEGAARLDGPQRVRVGDETLAAPHIVLATGSSPIRDTVPGLEDCATSNELLDLDALPPHAAVIGSGYIAVEFASALARLGVQVLMYYRAELPLRGFDPMLRAAAAAELQAAGVELHPGVLPRRVRPLLDGFALELGDEHVLETDWVLNATGRRPNSTGLGLETVGLAPREDGAVAVDAALRTGAAGVYAIGDLTQMKNLTPVAIAQGRALADMLFGSAPREVDLSLVASAVFMQPPIASIGPAEDELVAAGRKARVFETEFRPMKQAFLGAVAPAGQRTRMKLLVDAASDRVLAAHMIGADAPEIVQSLAVALSAGATKAHFDRTLAVHPTAAEEFVLMREPVRMLP
ncbi:MAG: glutathione-disulfide reductase [Proteobacteria bacterium]|nr:glutathione-disulfide reductase [Pseudomonadota bacterium]